MKEFSDCLADCKLVDHPATGYFYTWSNKAERMAKLDRVVMNQAWTGPLFLSFLLASLTTRLFCWIWLMILESPNHSNSLTVGPLPRLSMTRSHLFGLSGIMPGMPFLTANILSCKLEHIQLNDGSTQYFYSLIQERKLSKNIGYIEDSSGHLCQGRKNVANALLGYYTGLLGTADTADNLPSSLFQQGTLQPCHTSILIAAINDDEILEALKSIDRNKSPGVDGFTSGFFLDTRGTAGHNFCAAARDYIVTGVMPKAANSTLITLVPMVTTQKTVGDFRPISCCTTFCKTVSKVLAKRLRGVLGLIVGYEQAAFVQVIMPNIFRRYFGSNSNASQHNREDEEVEDEEDPNPPTQRQEEMQSNVRSIDPGYDPVPEWQSRGSATCITADGITVSKMKKLRE
ncbi:uncharacterized protein LOC141630555 [Silene latifolia]|uniref:uncharacterized protein LOC141630555 n=1 Tax=Silene latifolia TaxID=37657 RepID=UPI003D7726AF